MSTAPTQDVAAGTGPAARSLDTHAWVRAGSPTERLTYLQRYTITPRALGQRYTFAAGQSREAVTALVERDGLIGLPRTYGIQSQAVRDGRSPLADWIDHRTDGWGPVVFDAHAITLRTAQVPVVDATVALLERIGGAVIEALPGKGKTVMVLAVLAHLGVPALVIVQSEQLLQQWIKRAQQFLGLTREQIGIARQARHDGGGKALTIGLVQSIAKDQYGEAWKAQFGAVVYDECDLFPTAVFGPVLGMFAARYRIACTGTLERKDGMTRLLHWHVGPVAASLMEPDVVPMVYGLENPRSYRNLPFKQRFEWVQDGQPKVSYARMMQALGNDVERNNLLVRQIVRAHHAGRRSVVLTHEKAHAVTLVRLLALAGVHEVGLFTGDVKNDALLEAALQRQTVVGTYKMLGRGIDVDELDGMFFATPLSSPDQAVGRVLRYREGKPTPIVVDIVDTGVGPLRGMFASRCRWYDSIGAGGDWQTWLQRISS